jgi:HlyD family secretion protein
VSSKADLKVKRLALEKARRDVTTAEEALKKMIVYAPTGGVVDVAEHPWEGRKLEVGDTVMVGWTVMSIPDLSSMRVDAELSDVDQGRVQPGMKAVCTMDAFPGLAIDGYVRKVSPVAKPIDKSPTRRGFDVTVALDRSYPDKMRTGMSVKVAVMTRRMKDVLLAPRPGLDLSADPPLARLAGGREVRVTLGPCSPLECVVESGLKAGQRLAPRGGRRD